jgi:hypothetical protein
LVVSLILLFANPLLKYVFKWGFNKPW